MVELENIVKRFGECVALNHVTLQAQTGRIYGLWGKNGAGKTTLLRIICGISACDQGRVRVLGVNPQKQPQVRRQIGIVDDEDTYFPELTAREFLWWIGRLRRLTEQHCHAEIERWGNLFYIDQQLDHLTCSLSHGMRRKVALTAALIGEPELLLFDEPTNGLDVDAVDALCTILKKHRQKNGAAIVACHDLAFMHRICTDFITLQNGSIVKREVVSV